MNNFLVIDNWYNKKELSSVYKELDFLHLKIMESGDPVNAATDENGISKIKAHRISPYTLYSDEGMRYSPILKSIKKFQDKDFHKEIEKTFKNTNTALYEQFISTNHSSTIINYYENNDSYREHFDVFQFTILIFIYKKPKAFSGGDLKFNRIKKTVECKNNRLVLFPSFYYHEITPIKSETKKKGFGRYSISNFLSCRS
jgi:Rps23 Pro-64 3,4-dihydroxylase Tpa1-like proline 4-hydroxylase|tara:strand:- start:173 stop:772 length:600 start_codon:yes stop_codon:yes gene_type:complete